MRAENVIRGEGVVREVRSERLCRVELANGHQFWGFVPVRRAAEGWRCAVGDRVAVDFSPGDLSKGRIQAKL